MPGEQLALVVGQPLVALGDVVRVRLALEHAQEMGVARQSQLSEVVLAARVSDREVRLLVVSVENDDPARVERGFELRAHAP